MGRVVRCHGHSRTFSPRGAGGALRFPRGRKRSRLIAVNGRECRAGEKVELPRLELIGGGFISGQAIDTTTGRSVSVTDAGEPVTLGLYGPAQPQGAVTAPTGETVVDKAGRFILRVAPGEYFPYLVNSRGVHMVGGCPEAATGRREGR